MRFAATILYACVLLLIPACADRSNAQDPPATQPAGGKLPHLQVDVKQRQVRIECEALNVDMALEFFCVVSGTNEHESVLRSPVKPSDLHLALLMIGLKPGEPVRYSPASNKWLPPHGPPLQIFCEYEKDGKTVTAPAYRWMRSIKSKEPMPPLTWIFAGSRVMPDGIYAADTTGYLVSIVNFDLTVIDIPELASNSNETLEWEYNPDLVPPKGTPVWMVIVPAGKGMAEAAEEPAATEPVSDVTVDEERLNSLRRRWERAVAPHDAALREAAQTHYDVINDLRREQQRLIDEADRIQRVIDELEKEYQNMTTPRPAPVE